MINDGGATSGEASATSTTKQKIPMEKAKRIDVCSRFIFPLIFAVFNLVYWMKYLLQARNEYLKIMKKIQEDSEQ